MNPLNEHWLLLFVFFWAITDRIREIAIFPGWVSSIGKWFDTYYNPNIGTWYPFRDAYHTFKNIAVLFLFIVTWRIFDFMTAIYLIIIWMAGQFLGLLFRKN